MCEFHTIFVKILRVVSALESKMLETKLKLTTVEPVLSSAPWEMAKWPLNKG